ncbi:iron-siderophore ABC transporter substrate-binding protein [Anaeromicropila herbilytica]|uniref:Periplasmic binding protein n=1 Tax=Anaeromicropila herbilytica TaxID=2785025 RepID=A0A7R7IC39_9FIRM|nr:iron-siderophore ABC transporter substrate-binding protein [Anaeromicropila herbilytica]BCN29451.1 periplasmic binding protein [Anaeromicropila herbilytica]
MKSRKLSSMFVIILMLSLTACSNKVTKSSDSKESADSSTKAETSASNDSSTDTNVSYPITIKHAFGETVIENKPKNVVTISWGNQDVPLALGVVPAGISQANYGVTDGSGLLPWTKERFKELGVKKPVIFNDTDGLDYEAISDANPDVILASYSGITKEEYDLLSQIAPVVAYPTAAWQTYWRDQIILDATGMGMKTEGEQLVSDLEDLIADKTNASPQLKGKTVAFFYFNPADLGKFYVYLPTDPRAAYLNDLGMSIPASIAKLQEGASSFSIELSAEKVDIFRDVDIMVAYGDDTLLKALQADPLIGTIPAVKRGSVALIPDGTPLAASGTPSALSIPATIDEYLTILKKAADKVQ